jgi:hypothetical protein
LPSIVMAYRERDDLAGVGDDQRVDLDQVASSF